MKTTGSMQGPRVVRVAFRSLSDQLSGPRITSTAKSTAQPPHCVRAHRIFSLHRVVPISKPSHPPPPGASLWPMSHSKSAQSEHPAIVPTAPRCMHRAQQMIDTAVASAVVSLRTIRFTNASNVLHSLLPNSARLDRPRFVLPSALLCFSSSPSRKVHHTKYHKAREPNSAIKQRDQT